MSEIQPRVNAKIMANMVGHVVRLPAKVIKLQGDTAIVEAADKTQVRVSLSRHDSHVLTEVYVEILGKVDSANELKMLTVVNLGKEMDLELTNQVIEMSHKHFCKHMFQ